MSTMESIISVHLLLDIIGEIPEISIMLAPDVVRELVAERFADDLVVPIPIVAICSQAQFDHLSSVSIEPERLGLVRGMLGGIHLC